MRTEKEREKIITHIFSEKKVDIACLCCKGEIFTITDSFVVFRTSDFPYDNAKQKLACSKVPLPKDVEFFSIPAILVICDNCGYVRQHISSVLKDIKSDIRGEIIKFKPRS